MTEKIMPRMRASQRVVQVGLFVVALIAISGGAQQLVLGEPETTPRLDNIHRFMAGVYFSCGVIALWAAITIRQQGTLIYLLALTVFLGGVGRLVSMSLVGIPEPHSTWLRYVIAELFIPLILVISHRISNKQSPSS